MAPLQILAVCLLTMVGPFDGPGSGPSMDVVEPVLTASGQAEVQYSDPAKANQTVTIDIDDGGAGSDSIEIALDEFGNGKAFWTVGNWDLAKFNGPGVSEVTRVIVNASLPVPEPAGAP